MRDFLLGAVAVMAIAGLALGVLGFTGMDAIKSDVEALESDVEALKAAIEEETGNGETDAGATELHNIQTAVTAMMNDNNLASIPNPVTVATNNMGAFPDATSTEAEKGFTVGATPDKAGYLLWQHDMIDDDSDSTDLVNYVVSQYTKGTYTVDAQGTVTQVTTGYE